LTQKEKTDFWHRNQGNHFHPSKDINYTPYEPNALFSCAGVRAISLLIFKPLCFFTLKKYVPISLSLVFRRQLLECEGGKGGQVEEVHAVAAAEWGP
jgi:hypothetical protein